MKHKTYDNPKLKSKPTLNCVLMYNFYFLCVNISSCIGGLAENILVQNKWDQNWFYEEYHLSLCQDYRDTVKYICM